jgi:hypothetical protein
MPARMLRTVPQEATEFNQRMGCMAGVFQIFDRRHGLLTARRRGGGDRGARGTARPGLGTHYSLQFSSSGCFFSTTRLQKMDAPVKVEQAVRTPGLTELRQWNSEQY